MYPKINPNWFRTEQQRVPNLYQTDPTMINNWAQNEPTQIPNSSRADPQMIPLSDDTYPKLFQTHPIRNWSQMNITIIPNRTNTDPKFIPNGSHWSKMNPHNPPTPTPAGVKGGQAYGAGHHRRRSFHRPLPCCAGSVDMRAPIRSDFGSSQIRTDNPIRITFFSQEQGLLVYRGFLKDPISSYRILWGPIRSNKSYRIP